MDYSVGFILVLAAALALWAVASHLATVWKRRTMEARSAAWPSVTGRVIASSASEFTDPDGNSTCSPHVWYEYVVGGVHYMGDRLRFGVTDLPDVSREAVQNYVDTLYPAGAEVTVYYDPDKPDNAVLDRTPEKQPLSVVPPPPRLSR